MKPVIVQLFIIIPGAAVLITVEIESHKFERDANADQMDP